MRKERPPMDSAAAIRWTDSKSANYFLIVRSGHVLTLIALDPQDGQRSSGSPEALVNVLRSRFGTLPAPISASGTTIFRQVFATNGASRRVGCAVEEPPSVFNCNNWPPTGPPLIQNVSVG